MKRMAMSMTEGEFCSYKKILAYTGIMIYTSI